MVSRVMFIPAIFTHSLGQCVYFTSSFSGASGKTTHLSAETSFCHRSLAKFLCAPVYMTTLGAIFLYSHPADQKEGRGSWQDSGTATLPVIGVGDKI